MQPLCWGSAAKAGSLRDHRNPAGSGLHVLSWAVGPGCLASLFLGPGVELSSPEFPFHPVGQAVAPFYSLSANASRSDSAEAHKSHSPTQPHKCTCSLCGLRQKVDRTSASLSSVWVRLPGFCPPPDPAVQATAALIPH